jgi:hypothetical protein
MEAGSQEETSTIDCAHCGARLAHDQRYCLECGERRGALPPVIANLIGAARERGRPVSLPQPAEPEPVVPDRWSFDAWIRAPRAAATAVVGMLGFGVVVGTAVGGSVASTLRPLLVLVSTPAKTAPAVNNGGGGAGGGGSGGSAGGPLTITETSPAPAAAPAAAPSPAASPNQSRTGTGFTPPNGLPPLKHVFLVVLDNQGFNEAFVHTATDPYLGKKLVSQGELIYNYYAVAPGALANEIALVSGQGPTPQTVAGCPMYANIDPGAVDANGQAIGSGCVYPKSAKTLADELTASHRTWRAYVQVSRHGPAGACIHPKLGTADVTALPSTTHAYATWRNPFMYFHSLSARKTCAKDNVGLPQLRKDLTSAATTPALSYIVPDVCHDGSDLACVPNAPAGLGPADAFLKSVVPEIKRSPAYKDGGLIAITFDAAPQSGPNADSSSCCGNPTYPNLPTPTTTTTPTDTTAATTTPTDTTTTPTDTTTTPSTGAGTPPGGGQVGLLLISRYVKKGTSDVIDSFNHFSLLATIEEIFGLTRLGYAADKMLPVFGSSVFTAFRG